MNRINRLLSNLKLRSKLLILISIFLINLLAFGFVMNFMLKSSQTMTILISEDRVFEENFSIGKELFFKYEITGNGEDFDHSIEHFNNAFDIAYNFSVLDSIFENMPPEKWKLYLFNIFKEGLGSDMGKLEMVADQIKLFNKINPKKLENIQAVAGDASVLVKGTINKIYEYKRDRSIDKRLVIGSQFDQMQGYNMQFVQAFDSLGNYMTKMFYFLFGGLLFFLVMLGIILSLIISNSITKPITILSGDFRRMAKGDLKSSIKIDSENEIGDLSKAFYEIQVGLQNVVSHAKKIAQGDYKTRLKPYSDNDELSLSLNQMAEKLEESSIHSENENWLQKGLNGLDDQMRGNFSVRDLSERIIVFLSQFLSAEMGAVYVFDDVLDHLELVGSVGLNIKEVPQIVQPGDGLIGSVVKKADCQIIDAKDKFKTTYSATGEIYPEKLYLISLHFGDKIQAVIELASVHSLSELKLDYLKLIKERVSVNINAAVARDRNTELLDKSLEQAEKLKARDEELVQKLVENQRIRENLSRETALLDSMMKTLPDLIYFKDTESRFVRLSESLARLFGVKSSKEAIGKTDFDFFPRKEAKIYFDEEQEIIKKGEGIVDEVRTIINEDGEEMWTSVTKLPMYNEKGECIGTFGISKDVTNIKKLELEVNLQNEKLKQNQEELKATNEELHAQEEELRVANEELAEQTKILIESEKNLQVQQEELQVINEELETKSNILEQQKEEILKNNKKLEKAGMELEAKAKELELASQYKSEFLANMSHELRTPLNSMLILSKLLGDNKNKNLTEEQLKSISIIYNSGKDLLELINEILDLSKIEAGKMNFDFTDVLSNEIVEEIKVNFAPVAENKNLTLNIKKSGNFPEAIYTDRQRLMQLIKNLLSNAFKFTSKGGITVNFGVPGKNVNFINPKLNENNTCFIAVEDTGVGIPKNKVHAIFDAFQQADGSISRKFGGTGLGLSISKQIIQVFGGEIHVASTEGVGSEFTVYIPLDKNLIKQESREPVSENLEKEEGQGTDIKENKLPQTIAVSEKPVNVQLPVFIDDDRDASLDKIMVLIIHSEGKKAKALIDICHKKSFNAVAAATISDGIILAEKIPPQAIIISAELNGPKELSKLKDNKLTARVPLHVVSRIEDFMFEEIQELQTSESKNLQVGTKNIENKIGKEFRQVLMVEDDPATRMAIQNLFENKNIIIHEAKTATQAYEMISSQLFDCIILDLGLPDYSGAELLDKLKANKIPIPYVIINTGKDLSAKELRKLQQYSESIVIKGVKSDERLMDEVTLFLHQISNTLPRRDRLAALEDTGFKGKKVLVVDDDIRNVFAMAQILEEREIEILEAENGEVAIDVLKNNPDVDLVLMDVMMPVMNGYEAMKIIRKTEGIENTPIIILTAKAMKEDYQKAIDFGANDFISKPVDVDKLISLLKIWLFK